MDSTVTDVIDALDTSSITAKLPTKNVLAQKAQAAVGVPDSITIDSDAMLVVADDELRRLKTTRDNLEGMRKSISDPLYKVWKDNNALYKEPLEIIDASISGLSRKIANYHQVQQARIEQERRNAEAAAEAERQRLIAEAEARDDAASEAAISGDEKAAKRAEAEAESLLLSAAVVAPRAVDTAPPKVSGTSVSYRYSAKTPQDDAAKLKALKYIIENPQFLNLVSWDEAACNKLAVALRENINLIPGFEVVKTPVVSQRRK